MSAVIEPGEGKPESVRRGACDHKPMPFHKAEGAVFLCPRCERWLKCTLHVPSIGCWHRRVRWFNFGDSAKIRAYKDWEAE